MTGVELDVSPAGALLRDLRRNARWILLAAAAGAAAGAAGALVQPPRHVAGGLLLTAARTPDPEGHRRRPVSVDELRMHLDGALLDAATGSAGLPAGSLAGKVEISARSESGLYDVSVALPEPAHATAAADAVIAGLARRLNELRARKVEALVGSDERRKAAVAVRASADEAYLAEIRAGRLEQAELAVARGAAAAGTTFATDLAAARAERERLRLAAELARAAERIEEETSSRARASALAFEPAAEPFAAAGAPVLRKTGTARGILVGAGAGLVLALGLVLLVGAGSVPPAGRG